ncbi:MAG: class GN sortase [Hellea sp.]
MHKRARFGLSLTFAALGLALFGNGLYIGFKAVIAQNLMERAWTKTAQSGDVHLPWSWIDAHPVARLSFEGDRRAHIVLNTDSGQALAFGPAVISGTEKTDMMAIAAHKNTQFQNLKSLAVGETIWLERPKGEVLTYHVTHTKILDSRVEGLAIEAIADTPSRLALVTCYPFDAVSFNGPMRYVVYAKRV